MRKLTTFGFIAAFSILGVLYAWARLRSELEKSGVSSPVIIEGPQKHVVTPEMLEATEKMAQKEAPVFRAEATDGKSYSLEELTTGGPVLLAFIKETCPCSRAAEPFFNRLHDAYGSNVSFFGVIDGSVDTGRSWAKENHVRFPILSDPDLKMVHEYKAESSAYVALIAKGGKIEKLWPGYSIEMLREASERLARLAGTDVKTIDATDAPTEMTTGCPY